MARKLPKDKKERNLTVLAIQKAIQARFNATDWAELGYATAANEWLDNHPRLYRSLNWNEL